MRVGRKNGAVGAINNSFPMTIGGKSSCDYFSGEIDYIRVYRDT